MMKGDKMMTNYSKDKDLNESTSSNITHINGVPIPKELSERIIYEDMQKRNRTMSKFRWVNDDVKIDFPVSKLMKNTMEEAEQYDLEKNTSEYNAVSEMIELFGKEGYVTGMYTKEQWDKLCERYPYV